MDTVKALTDFYKFSSEEHTYDEWFNKFFTFSFMECGSCSTVPFWIFKALVMDKFCCTPHIPIEYELDLFLKCINAYCNIENNYSTMRRTMLNREQEEHKQSRIAEVK